MKSSRLVVHISNLTLALLNKTEELTGTKRQGLVQAAVNKHCWEEMERVGLDKKEILEELTNDNA